MKNMPRKTGTEILFLSQNCKIALKKNQKQKFIISEYIDKKPVFISLPLPFHSDIYNYCNWKNGIHSENIFKKTLNIQQELSEPAGEHFPQSKNHYSSYKNLKNEINANKQRSAHQQHSIMNTFIENNISGKVLEKRILQTKDFQEFLNTFPEKYWENSSISSSINMYLEKISRLEQSYSNLMKKFSQESHEKINRLMGTTRLNENNEKNSTTGGSIEINNPRSKERGFI